MTLEKGLVSIVIPAYNAEKFITETIDSILAQTYPSWEIILVNDGSTDKTEEIARSYADKRINVITQSNAGVSTARNTGFQQVRGEFVCFFDADDRMTPAFLKTRTDLLTQRSHIGFVGGLVESFPVQRPVRKPVAQNPEQEIHFFDINFVTVPSTYLFRTSIIKDNSILFHPALHSSADRFFLLHVARHAKGMVSEDLAGSLQYRVSETSMSHHITPKLVLDYHRFYKELKKDHLIPEKRKREIECRYLFSIASGFYLVRYWGTGSRLMIRSFFKQPLVFLRITGQRIFKRKK